MAERPRASPSYWQRRYVLRHYRRWSDETLAHGSGLPSSVVRAVLDGQGASRSHADMRHIERSSQDEPPRMFTPGTAWRWSTALHSRPLTRLDALLIAAMSLASLVLYGLTAARTVTGEDAGELLAAAHGFGVPHPPGYPLWMLLGWSFDHAFPFGTVAWRISMVSAVFSAAANALLLALALKTMVHRLAACAGAALFAVSLTHWTQAVIPEVYGLNTFFVALAALLLVRLKEQPTAGRLLVLAFVTGLSCTNHTTALPIAVLVAGAAVLIAPRLFLRPLAVVGALVLGALPLALYLILPLASAHEPYIDWGNPETSGALWEHVTRSQYAGIEDEAQAATSYDDYLHRLGILGRSAMAQFGSGWLLVLSVIGFYAMLVRQTGLFLFLMVIGWLCSIGVTQYTTFSFDREHVYANQIFWIPAWLTLSWLAAGGVDVLLLGLRQASKKPAPAPTAAAGLVLVLLVAIPAARHYERTDRSRTTFVAEYGGAILDVMEEGALYFPSSDHSTFSVMFWQGVEGIRTDVVIADKYGQIDRALLESVVTDEDRGSLVATPPKARRRAEEALLIQRWNGPVYFANRRDMTDLPDHQLEPCGPVFRVMSADEATAWWDGESPGGLAVWERLADAGAVDERQQLDFTVQMVRGDMLYMKGFALLRAGRIDEAVETWSLIEADLAPLKQLYNNIGSALAEHGKTAEAVTFYERAIEEDRKYVLAWRNKAVVHRARDEPSNAITCLETLLRIDPEQREARFVLARLLAQVERVVDALAQYEALATLDREDPHPWTEAGDLLAKVGDRGKAIDAYTESLRLDPRQHAVHERLDRLKQGIDLLADEGASADDGPGGLGLPQPVPGAQVPIPGAPQGPSSGLQFDPMRGLGLPRP